MAFPPVKLLDSFKRSENPLSNGEKWHVFQGLGGTGSCNGTEWETPNIGTNYGAYWTPLEFTNPGVAITRSNRIEDNGSWYIWACMSNPLSTEISGYRLRLHREIGSLFGIKIERCTKNSFTVLSTTTEEKFSVNDSLGLAVQEGNVEYWHKKGPEAIWEKIASVADTTYTKGFVGLSGEVANGDTVNFEAENSSSTPGVENPGTQRNRILKEVSVQIKAKNVTKYFASGLPKGLSISESTGLITGEPSAVESTTVKVKVENEAKEVAETSFEWIIFKVANVINMVVC